MHPLGSFIQNIFSDSLYVLFCEQKHQIVALHQSEGSLVSQQEIRLQASI